jgi:membrane-associated phospholipid phosphatase
MKRTAIAAIICAVLVFLSVEFVDRPVLMFVVHHRRFAHAFEIMAMPSLLPLPLAVIYVAVFVFKELSGRPRSAYTNLFLTLSLAVVIVDAAKDELKFLIGRPWPMEWLRGGVYHLEPFTDSVFFGGFPSGHTAYIAAPMFVLWWRLPPQYRPIWMTIVAMVMTGLVGYGFHFLGDVIGGFFLGMAVAAGVVALLPETPADRVADAEETSFTRVRES